MDWITEYQNDITALEGLDFPVNLDDEEQTRQFLEDFEEVLTPLQDGDLGTGDIDTIVERYWQKFNMFEVTRAKKEVTIHRRLIPLYQRLEQASDEEWEAYAQMRLRGSFQSQPMRALFRMQAKEKLLPYGDQGSV